MSTLFQMFNFFNGLWDIFTDYFWAVVVIAAALAVAWFVPSVRVRFAALCVAGAVIATTVAYSVGIHKENERWKARARAAVQQEIKDGEQARADGGAAVDRAGDDGVQNDRFNRDTWSK